MLPFLHCFLVFLIISQISASTLKVIHPYSLIKEFSELKSSGFLEKGPLITSVGNFGHIDYGTSVMGLLHYPVNNTNGCLPFEDNQFNTTISQLHAKDHSHKPIIMVDRGQCHFVLKAQHAEAFGGVMLVVIDNKKNENIDRIVMADDGKGSSVHIPSFLIGYKDG